MNIAFANEEELAHRMYDTFRYVSNRDQLPWNLVPDEVRDLFLKAAQSIIRDEAGRERPAGGAPPRPSRDFVTLTVCVDEDQLSALQSLSKVTRTPVAEYIRSGVDVVLGRNRMIPS